VKVKILNADVFLSPQKLFRKIFSKCNVDTLMKSRKPKQRRQKGDLRMILSILRQEEPHAQREKTGGVSNVVEYIAQDMSMVMG